MANCRLLVPLLCMLPLVLSTGCAKEPEAPEFPKIMARDAPDDEGKEIVISFAVPLERMREFASYGIERAEKAEGPWVPVATLDGGSTDYAHKDSSETLDSPAVETGKPYWYRVVAKPKVEEGADAPPDTVTEAVGPVEASASLWDTKKWAVFFALAVFSGLVFFFISLSKKNPDIYVRPIGGLAAMQEAIGRATEMGRPVLYIPGIADMDDIQTITSLVILREIAKQTAEYETPMIVPCRSPVVMTAAEEAVRTGCMEAGAPELFNPDNIRFLSDEQFAFTAATNGIMLRERPATNVYIGAFWAESLILAETGFLAGAIQIAGTAMVSQLPFFVAACDYTLIGEEIYAASAYLSREPMLMGSLKGSDWAKVLFAVLMIVGMVAAFKPRTELSAKEHEVAGAAWTEVVDTDSFSGAFLSKDDKEPVMVQLRLTVTGGDLAIDDVEFHQVHEAVEDLPSRIANGDFAKGFLGWRHEGLGAVTRSADYKAHGKFAALKDGSYLLSPPFEVTPGESYALRFSAHRGTVFRIPEGKFKGDFDIRLEPGEGSARVTARLEEASSLYEDYIEYFK